MDYEIFVSNAGVGTAGCVLAWESLVQRDGGGAEGSPPAFTDRGGGWYIFSYTPTETMLGVIDCDSNAAIGLSNADRYVPCKFTIYDENLDTTISSRSSSLALATIGASIDDVSLALVTIDAAIGDIQAVTDNLPNAGALSDISLALVTIDSVAGAIKDKTDGLNFTGDDVKATLDGEEVDIGLVKGVGVTSVDDFKADISGLSTFDPSSDEVDIGSVKGTPVTNVDDFKANVSNLDATVSSRSTFNPSSDEVDIGKVKGVAVTGVNDFKANVSNLATSAALSTTDTKITGIKTVTDKLASIDGLDPNTALEIILAMASGRFTKSSNVYTFYKQDNLTVLFTLSIDAETGERTRS